VSPEELKSVGSFDFTVVNPSLHDKRAVHALQHNMKLDRSFVSSIRTLAKEMKKEYQPRPFLYSQDGPNPIVGRRDPRNGYKILTQRSPCKEIELLNLSKMSKKYPFFKVGLMELNPSGSTFLLAIDFIGSQCFHLFLKPRYTEHFEEIKLHKEHILKTTDLLSNLRFSTPCAMWLNDDEILYVSINRYYNDSGVYVYNLLTQKNTRLYNTPHGYFLDMYLSTSGLFVIIKVQNYNSDEILLLDVDSRKITTLFARKPSTKYLFLQHEAGLWHVAVQERGRHRIYTSPDLQKKKILYENKHLDEQILEIDMANQSFVFTVSCPKSLKLLTLSCGKLALLHESRQTDYFSLETYLPNSNEYKILQHKYTCPPQEYLVPLHNINLEIRQLKPRYTEKEVFLRPGLRVTLIYKGTPHLSPCILFGYGAYNSYEGAKESIHLYPMIERGFVVAIAHLRGGGEYGYQGYKDGRMQNKKNTFDDFIETVHGLFDRKITSRDKLVIWGRSFGGLLISSVLNMEPDICKVALVGVPFITPLETMSTHKTPLGIETRSELGDINRPAVHDYIKSYSPLEHIQKDAVYPNVLIYTNLNDTLVPYKEPLLYYKSLQHVEAYKRGERNLSFYMDPRFGHHQGTHLKDIWEHYGLLFTYVLKYI
jgi:protease II